MISGCTVGIKRRNKGYSGASAIMDVTWYQTCVYIGDTVGSWSVHWIPIKTVLYTIYFNFGICYNMLSVKQRGAVVCWYNTLSFDLSKAILWHSRLDTGGLRPYDADNCWFDGRRRMLDDYCFGADWWFVAKGRSNSNTRLAFSRWFGLSKCCIRLWNFLFWRIAALSRASTGRLALFWGAYRSKWWRHHHTMCWRGWCRPIKDNLGNKDWLNSELLTF